MFSRKRHFYEKKTFYAAIVTAFTLVLSLSLWMGGDTEARKDPQEMNDPSGGMKVLEQDTQVSSVQVDENVGPAGITGNGEFNPPMQSGFLVVEEDQYIKVYLFDTDGTKQLVRTTDISFDLLSSEDQELFRYGVKLETESQLMELLQDFES